MHSRTNLATRPAAIAIEAAVERVVLMRAFGRRRHKRAVTSRILKLAHELPPPPDEVLSVRAETASPDRDGTRAEGRRPTQPAQLPVRLTPSARARIAAILKTGVLLGRAQHGGQAVEAFVDLA